MGRWSKKSSKNKQTDYKGKAGRITRKIPSMNQKLILGLDGNVDSRCRENFSCIDFPSSLKTISWNFPFSGSH